MLCVLHDPLATCGKEHQWFCCRGQISDMFRLFWVTVIPYEQMSLQVDLLSLLFRPWGAMNLEARPFCLLWSLQQARREAQRGQSSCATQGSVKSEVQILPSWNFRVVASSPLGTQQGMTSRQWNKSREKHFHHVRPDLNAARRNWAWQENLLKIPVIPHAPCHGRLTGAQAQHERLRLCKRRWWGQGTRRCAVDAPQGMSSWLRIGICHGIYSKPLERLRWAAFQNQSHARRSCLTRSQLRQIQLLGRTLGRSNITSFQQVTTEWSLAALQVKTLLA